MIKAIIFDCFGVLVGTGYWNVYQRLGGDLTKDREFLDDILDRANVGIISSEQLHTKTARRLGIPRKQWIDAIRKDELPNEEIFAYIKNNLKGNYRLGMISNVTSGVIHRLIPEDLLKLFDAVIVSGDVGLIKPDPNIFILAAEKLGVPPEECVFIDDHAEYLEGAWQIGVTAIQFFDTNKLIFELSQLSKS